MVNSKVFNSSLSLDLHFYGFGGYNLFVLKH